MKQTIETPKSRPTFYDIQILNSLFVQLTITINLFCFLLDRTTGPLVVITTLLGHLDNISSNAMYDVWDHTPYNFQQLAIPRLLMMICPPHRPEALLLVQGTSGVKSIVTQTV